MWCAVLAVESVKLERRRDPDTTIIVVPVQEEFTWRNLP